jgi:hypothetical protein
MQTDPGLAEPEREPGATTDLVTLQSDQAAAEAAAQWCRTRYRRWWEEQQHAEPGLRPALLRLALASSLMQPPVTADVRTGLADLSGDVVGMIGVAVESGAVESAQWRRTRYRRWREEQQHAEPGLRPALLRLALASSLMRPALTAGAQAGLMYVSDLAADLVEVVGAVVESALQFCGVLQVGAQVRCPRDQAVRRCVLRGGRSRTPSASRSSRPPV